MGGRDCQTVGSRRIDDIVAKTFLEAAAPANVEVAIRAEEVLRQQRADHARLWDLQVEKARYEAERAERQYHAVEPENRLVARSLERCWNERLEALETVRVQAAAASRESPPLTKDEVERLSSLVTALEAIWTAPSTTNRDRKNLIRCLVEEVQLRTEERRYRVRIVWSGGAVTDREAARVKGGRALRTSEDTVELVRVLAPEFDDTQIARILNKQGRRTGLDNTFSKVRVTSMRGKYGIPACRKKRIVDPREGPFTADEAADEMGVCVSTIHRWLREGVLAGEQMTAGAPWRISLTEEVRERLTGGAAPDGWVGLTEAARRLGLTKSHAAYLVKTGKLPAVRVTVGKRRCWRIDVSSVTFNRQPDMFDQMSTDPPGDA